MELHTWLIYWLAVAGLSITPGPNSLLALTHGAMYGHKRTLFTISGGVLGFTVQVALSMFGIGALLAASSDALVLLKWIGGAYLVWLGIQLWYAPALNITTTEHMPQKSGWRLFQQGGFSALSNPKALLFFGAFLPQFIDQAHGLMEQFVVMVITLAVTEFFVEYLLARIAHRVRPWLEQKGKRFNQCCGGMFAMIGIALPLSR